MTQEFTTALKSEMKHIDVELARLQDRRKQIESLLADVKPVKRVAAPSTPPPALSAPKAKAARGRKVKTPSATYLTNGQSEIVGEPLTKPKGWPKGMPRDKDKRHAWLKTDAGALYLRNFGFASVETYWSAQGQNAADYEK